MKKRRGTKWLPTSALHVLLCYHLFAPYTMQTSTLFRINPSLLLYIHSSPSAPLLYRFYVVLVHVQQHQDDSQEL